MRHFEESQLALELLDRHVQSLLSTMNSTLYTSLIPFIAFINSDPLLAAFTEECVERTNRAYGNYQRRCLRVARTAKDWVSRCRDHVDQFGWAAPDLEDCEQLLQAACQGGDDLDPVALAETLERAIAWAKLSTAEAKLSTAEAKEGALSTLSEAEENLAHCRSNLKKLELGLENFVRVDAGLALTRLQQAIPRYASPDELALDSDRNIHVDAIRARIREAEAWGKAFEESGQPYIEALHRDIRTLHLALSTALVRGRSRWQTVRRFAARCEGFARDRLLREVAASQGPDGRQRAEAVLTNEFAGYLHDRGFNPLVDAAACGLRPDTLDATSEPALYVEAKQYQDVSEAIRRVLKDDLSQTLNTWMRLANRWSVPEAFLLLFRRSGRPLQIEPNEVPVAGRRLYVLVVDLGGPEESGSRAKEPVRVNLHELLKP